MNLTQLRYFAALADELHFGRAAARLHLSQPALSHQVRKLEASLGVRLFDRTSRRVELTEAGRELLVDAREILGGVARLEGTAARHRLGVETVVVGFTGTAASRVLPSILERLRRTRPQARVSLRELSAERYDLLRSGELDVVLGRLRGEEMPDLDVLVLGEEPRVAALPSAHPLAGRAELRLDELAGDAFITQPEDVNPAFRGAWLAEQHAAGLPGRIAAEATSVGEFLNLVAAGRGVCVAPAAVAEYHPWPGVSYVPVAGVTPATTTVAVRRERRTATVKAFVAAALA